MFTLATRTKVCDAIKARKPFRASGMSAQVFAKDSRFNPLDQYPRHRLSPTMHSALLNAWRKHGVYVIYSYDTPIAWVVGLRGITLNGDYYSSTTSRHLNIARQALSA